MTYQIRDRQDGMFEIVIMKPVLAGIFPERETAERFCAYLADQEPELIAKEPASFGQAARDVLDAQADDLLDPSDDDQDVMVSVPTEPRVMSMPKTAHLPTVRKPAKGPVVADSPRMAAQISQSSYWPMSLEDTQTALTRIQNGEKIVDVAKDYPVSMMQLRAKWANWKRNLQKYIAEAGPQPCRLCAREFMPSISNPDTCARCSK